MLQSINILLLLLLLLHSVNTSELKESTRVCLTRKWTSSSWRPVGVESISWQIKGACNPSLWGWTSPLCHWLRQGSFQVNVRTRQRLPADECVLVRSASAFPRLMILLFRIFPVIWWTVDSAFYGQMVFNSDCLSLQPNPYLNRLASWKWRRWWILEAEIIGEWEWA